MAQRCEEQGLRRWLDGDGQNGIENHSASTVFLGKVVDNNANLGINSVVGVVAGKPLADVMQQGAEQ